jgi:hypothetical protein
MKKLYYFILSVGLTMLLTSCEKEDNILDPITEPPTKADVTPIGSVVGTAVSFNIGPAGGRIESEDHGIRIDIPAGALTDNQTISVQPLDENHCPGGAGKSFRLLPHGLTFAKPATITFSYAQEDISDSDPELLRVAYQADDHGWYSPGTASIDTTAMLVTVNTTHFSDWALLKSAHLDPQVVAVDPGASTQIAIRAHIFNDEPGDKYVPVFATIDAKHLEKWILQGEGNLVKKGKLTATYTAPNKIPANNPQFVTAVLSKTINNVKRQIRLKASIYVLGEGLVFRINGGPWIPTTSPLGLSKVRHGAINRMVVQTGSSAPGMFVSVSLSWAEVNPNAVSYSVPWQLKANNNEMYIPTIFLSVNPKGTPLYTFFYEQNKTAYPSPGNLQIAKKAFENGGYYIGTFTLKKAGIVEYSGGTDQIFDGTALVEGYFRFKLARNL